MTYRPRKVQAMCEREIYDTQMPFNALSYKRLVYM